MTILEDAEALRDLEELPSKPSGSEPPPADGSGPDEPAAGELPAVSTRATAVVVPVVIAAGVVVGMVFEGPAAKVLPPVAGVLGVLVAAQASRRKGPLAANLVVVLGIVSTGLLLVIPTGLANVVGLLGELREAGRSRSVVRPPADFLPGFRAMVGWLMAGTGFSAGWVAMELRRPALALVVPLPIIVIGAVSVPTEAKLPVGLGVLVLFLASMTVLSSVQAAGDAGLGLAYELRRSLRIVPLVGGLVVALVFLARMNVLFPPPLYDPVREAQRPKAVPLSEVQDKVLFEVRSRSQGPWRIGLLDVYDGEEWRLPAFSESTVRRIPSSGVVDATLAPGVRADFVVRGLEGAVLPSVPNAVGILAQGPQLGHDVRTGNIRLLEGQIRPELSYTVTGAALPTEEQLAAASPTVPRSLLRFLDMPSPPPAVRALLAEAPAAPAWQRLSHVRQRFLETVTADGPGTPVAVPPSRVEDMLTGSKEGSPFEIVAAQAMLARWAGVPARIGYGFDGGDLLSEDRREVRPRHGASWLETWFPGFGWVPIVGSPLKAKPSLTDEATNPDASVAAGDEIAVQTFVPLRIEEKGLFYDRVRKFAIVVTPLLGTLAAVYLLWPAARKYVRSRRRRAWARSVGPAARVEVAYASFRDYCTDLALPNTTATPLGFVAGFTPDSEHLELAWLVTRALYGDLRDQLGPDDARVAEELSSSLRRRLSRTQPLSLRILAAVSRLSLRSPYAAEVRAPTRKERRELLSA